MDTEGMIVTQIRCSQVIGKHGRREGLTPFYPCGRNYSITKRKIGPQIKAILVSLLGIYARKTVGLEDGKYPFLSVELYLDPNIS